MVALNCRVVFRACQAALVVALCSAVLRAAGAEAGGADVPRAVKMLKRLENTCKGYHGANAHKLLDAMKLEAVRLYQEAKYDPALDAILLACAMYPAGSDQTYYGLQPGMVEIALRWPSKADAKLLALDAKQYRWAMVAVANLSGVKLDLAAMQAMVSQNSRAVTDASGKPTGSLIPNDPALKRVLGARLGLLARPTVNQGDTATFPVVFPSFGQWTDIRFVEEENKIDVVVTNYASVLRNLGRYRQARQIAAQHRGKRDATSSTGPTTGGEAQPKRPSYVLVGYIRNVISSGQYGIRIVDAGLAKKHSKLFVRLGNKNIAELRRMGSGTIAQVVRAEYEPRKGDGVYAFVKK